MGSLTLANGDINFRSEVLFQLERRSDTAVTGAAGTARLDRAINQALVHAGHPSVFMHRELQAELDLTLSDGTDAYVLTVTPRVTGVYSARLVKAATVTATAETQKLWPQAINQRDQRTLTNGIPSRYAIDGNSLLVDPVPTASEAGWHVLLRHFKEPTLLSAAGDTTELPFYWDEVIVLGGTWRMQRDLGYRALAEETKQDYTALINEIQADSEINASDSGWAPGLVLEHVMET